VTRKTILIDELRLSFHVPRGLPQEEYQAISRTLGRRRFRAALGKAVREVVRRYPSLSKVRVTIAR
jgi:hypothetical protein